MRSSARGLSMMARNTNVPSGPDTEAQDQSSPDRHFRLATRGRSIQMGQRWTHAPKTRTATPANGMVRGSRRRSGRRFIAGPIRSRSLNRVLDPRPINDHVVGWKPNVGISQIVIDPIAVVVDLGLCELHAGKRYAGSRLSELLTRLHFLHLHSSGSNTSNLAVVHFGIDIDFFPSCMDLVLAILFEVFTKEVFSIEMKFLLCEGGARRDERSSCRDHSEYETPIDHELVPFGRDSVTHNVVKFSA